jgi:conjugal transfer pilus assembly protein TraK
MKKIIQFIICMMIPNIAISAYAHTTAPVTIKIDNDHQANIELSTVDINRIFVKHDKITSINAPDNRVDAHNDSTGSVYINVNGVTPFTTFLTTKNNRHFSMLVIPKSEPGVTVRFVAKTRIKPHYIHHRRSALRFEQSTPYEKTLVSLIKATMLHNTPPGYSTISDQSLSSMPEFVAPKYVDNISTLPEQVVKGYLGGELAVRVLKVINKSKKPDLLIASDFYLPGVRAVAISNELVEPNKSSLIYEVTTNV